jgi:hypothetical protein
LSELTRKELQKELRQHQLRTSGKKDLLLQRLGDAVAKEKGKRKERDVVV